MNQESVLRVVIQNKKEIELNILANSLNALSSQYDSFLRDKIAESIQKPDRNLIIKEVKAGSIIIELVGSSLPLIVNVDYIDQFFLYLKHTVDFFLKKTEEKKYDYRKKDCSDFQAFVEPTARDIDGAQINLAIPGNNNTIVINNTIANALQSNVKRYKKT